jgi:hypothetical protein
MIDDATKIIFVENSKSASTAVRRALTGAEQMALNDPRIESVNHGTPGIVRYLSFVFTPNCYKLKVIKNTRLMTGLLTDVHRQKNPSTGLFFGFLKKVITFIANYSA